MKIHQKKAKITLVFDGIKVAFSHPLGLTVISVAGDGGGCDDRGLFGIVHSNILI